MNPKIDTFLCETKRWRSELERLRKIILDCGLTEELKWKQPCYSFEGTNVLIMGELKNTCVLSFLKGALLCDADNLLSKPGENSQSARTIHFTSVNEIAKLEPVLKAYIFEAIEVEKAGLKVEFQKLSELDFVEELQKKLAEHPAFKKAFESLTPGRQRAYNLHFSAAKQSKTRESRIENCTPRILCGKGLNDCTCGHSKKMPGCDGSHKYI